jgi:hypothetical protein
VKRELSLEQTLEMAGKVQQRALSADASATFVEEVLAQRRGASKTESSLGYSFVSATKS